jgi:hypothetical protein
MAAHKGPTSLRPRSIRSGSSVAAIPVYQSIEELVYNFTPPIHLHVDRGNCAFTLFLINSFLIFKGFHARAINNSAFKFLLNVITVDTLIYVMKICKEKLCVYFNKVFLSTIPLIMPSANSLR